MKRHLLAFLAGLLVLPALLLGYLKLGNPPVAATDPPLPFEKKLVRGPLGARIDREMPKVVPLPVDEATLEAGVTIYQAECAACHGLPGRPSSFARHMFPPAPQLFLRHGDHVGVSDDPPGETYWIVRNGIRLSGMPAYGEVLSETQMWQVTVLLANADKLPGSVQQRLKPPSAE